MNFVAKDEEGQKVRCTKCGHVWVHSNKKTAKESGIKVDICRNLPVVIEYVVPTWFKLVPVVLMALIILTTFFFFQENFSDRSKTWRAMYSIVGVPYNRNLIIEKLDVSRVGDRSLGINASLINKSEEIRKLPSLIVRAIDAHNKNIGSFYIDPNVSDIVGGGEYNFSKQIDNLPLNTKFVVAELQSKFDWVAKRH